MISQKFSEAFKRSSWITNSDFVELYWTCFRTTNRYTSWQKTRLCCFWNATPTSECFLSGWLIDATRPSHAKLMRASWRFLPSSMSSEFSNKLINAWELSRKIRTCLLLLRNINIQTTYRPFSHREYPCDHYTSVITVTMVISGCPRVDIQATALQLLQLLDKRFFGTVGLLQSDKVKGKTNNPQQ